MVSFYKPANKKHKKSPSLPRRSQVTIDSWDWQGQGVVRGKQVMFIEGALPGEVCSVDVTQAARHVAHGKLRHVDSAHASRVTPFCPVAAQCGGCQLQHVTPDKALLWRQQAIEHKLLSVLPQDAVELVEPVRSPVPEYRRKARLAVDARTPGKLKVGYRAKRDNAVVDIESCPVLLPSLSAVIAPLKSLLNQQKGARHIGHISLLAGDDVAQITLKATRVLSSEMREALTDFAKQHGLNMLIEGKDGDIDTLHRHNVLRCNVTESRYIEPMPNDFIQVNAEVNRAMVSQALAWMDVKPTERIADWFCGLGNFSLALYDAGASVQAVEGVAEMVQRGAQNALAQGISGIDWRHADLSDPRAVRELLSTPPEKLLLDPSREGAQVVCEGLTEKPVGRIVYVSCNPGTFIRDAAILAGAGYHLDKLGLVEMFPFTQHLEMMALFSHSSL